MRRLGLTGLSLAVRAAGAPAWAAPVLAADAQHGQRLFCHGRGASLGPSLVGIVGRATISAILPP